MSYVFKRYIKLQGTDWINTDYCATSTTKVEVDAKFNNLTVQQRIFGYQVEGPASIEDLTCVMYINGNGAWAYSFNYSTIGTWTTTEIPADGYRHTFTLDGVNAQVKIDDTVISITAPVSGKISAHPMLIGNCSRVNVSTYEEPDTVTPKSTMNIYGAKIYDGSTLVRNFIPCYDTTTAVYGLYDTVNSTFHACECTSGITSTTIGGGHIANHIDKAMSLIDNTYWDSSSIAVPRGTGYILLSSYIGYGIQVGQASLNYPSSGTGSVDVTFPVAFPSEVNPIILVTPVMEKQPSSYYIGRCLVEVQELDGYHNIKFRINSRASFGGNADTYLVNWVAIDPTAVEQLATGKIIEADEYNWHSDNIWASDAILTGKIKKIDFGTIGGLTTAGSSYCGYDGYAYFDQIFESTSPIVVASIQDPTKVVGVGSSMAWIQPSGLSAQRARIDWVSCGYTDISTVYLNWLAIDVG